jgi:hypothetical protein
MSIRRKLLILRPRRPRPTCNRRDGPPLAAIFQIVVECKSERDQRRVYERMTAEGRKCRVLTL